MAFQKGIMVRTCPSVISPASIKVWYLPEFAMAVNGLIGKNVRLSDNLVIEFSKQKSPLADLSLELRVNGGGVGHVDWGTSEGDNTTLPSFMFLVWIQRISKQPGGSGILMSTSLSNQLKTVSSTSTITSGVTTGLGNRIQLVEEHHARSSGAGLVEDITDVGFGLTEPHSK